jgi:hypothetical protein
MCSNSSGKKRVMSLTEYLSSSNQGFSTRGRMGFGGLNHAHRSQGMTWFDAVRERADVHRVSWKCARARTRQCNVAAITGVQVADGWCAFSTRSYVAVVVIAAVVIWHRQASCRTKSACVVRRCSPQHVVVRHVVREQQVVHRFGTDSLTLHPLGSRVHHISSPSPCTTPLGNSFGMRTHVIEYVAKLVCENATPVFGIVIARWREGVGGGARSPRSDSSKRAHGRHGWERVGHHDDVTTESVAQGRGRGGGGGSGSFNVQGHKRTAPQRSEGTHTYTCLAHGVADVNGKTVGRGVALYNTSRGSHATTTQPMLGEAMRHGGCVIEEAPQDPNRIENVCRVHALVGGSVLMDQCGRRAHREP